MTNFRMTNNELNQKFWGAKYQPELVGPAEVQQLHRPAPASHKGDNGILLIVAGSPKFHGAALLTVEVASRVVDLIYFCSTPQNNALLEELKKGAFEFATLTREQVWQYVDSYDAVLAGPGLEPAEATRELVHELLKDMPDTKFVIDAGALRVIDKADLDDRVLLTPHAQEFETLFGFAPTPEGAQALAKELGCVFLLKGRTDYIVSASDIKENITGNAGLTKGGTGDVLAGLAAAFACTNDLFLSAGVAAFINGLAGDRLYQRVAEFYNASDLAREIPAALKWSLKFKS